MTVEAQGDASGAAVEASFGRTPFEQAQLCSKFDDVGSSVMLASTPLARASAAGNAAPPQASAAAP